MAPLRLFLIAGLWVAAGFGWAADDNDLPAPRLVCPEPEYSFGAAANTREIIHDFIIRNEGAAPLLIRQVKIPCGCMLVRLTDKKIDPGEQTSVCARFPLKGLSGGQRKRIIVLSNDPLRPSLELILTGEAVTELDVRPRRLFWGNLLEDAAVERTLEVRFRDNANCHLLGARSASARFAVETSEEDEPAAWVKVRTVPPLRRGGFEENLTILTDHPRYPAVEVPMTGRVVGELYVIPEELVLAPSNQPLARALMVYSAGKQNFKVLRVQAPAPGIEVKTRESVFGGCRVELKNLVPDPALDGKSIVITTDYSPLPELAVPLRIREPEPNQDRK